MSDRRKRSRDFLIFHTKPALKGEKRERNNCLGTALETVCSKRDCFVALRLVILQLFSEKKNTPTHKKVSEECFRLKMNKETTTQSQEPGQSLTIFVQISQKYI